jgi:hypothetical protein
MLIAVAVVAVGIGIQADRAREQEQAAARIRELGGSVQYGYQTDDSGVYLPRPQRYRVTPHGPPWLRQWLGPHYFNRVVDVRLSMTEVSDEDLACLQALPRLKWLGLEKTHVTSEGLVHLKRARHLTHLFLGNTDIDDEGLQYIAHLTELEMLQLNDRITDTGLAHLCNLTNLKDLCLNHAQVTDDGLPHLATLTNLERLHLQGTRVTDAGLRHLETLGKLKWVGGRRTEITPAGAARLQSQIPGLSVSVDRAVERDGFFTITVEWREITRLGLVVTGSPCTVREILPFSPASRANVKKGDIVLGAAGEAIRDGETLLRVAERQELGAKLPLRLRRGDETVRAEVLLDNF